MNISYPVRFSKEEVTPEKEEKKAVKLWGHENSVGFFPVGRLNNWHGGVHIEGDYEVTAIADGRVIAYRIAENNFTQSLLAKNQQLNEFSHSNGFVLIQHDYLSPKGQEFTFYSLYHHLMTRSEMVAQENIPDLFSKYSVEVIRTEKVRGLNIRSSSKLIEGRKEEESLGKVQAVVPIGHEVELIPEPIELSQVCIMEPWSEYPESTEETRLHWSEYYNGYRKVRYTDWYGNRCITRTGYAHMSGLKLVSGYTYKVKTCEDADAQSENGVMVMDRPDLYGEGKYLDSLTEGETVNVDRVEGRSGWWKIRDEEKYIRMKGQNGKDLLKVHTAFRDELVSDEVVNVEWPIQAGEVVGRTGLFGFKNNERYQSVHVEVFSADEGLEDFLENAIDDDKYFWTTEEGAEGIELYDIIESTFDADSDELLATPITKGSKVKIYKKVGEYIQIGFEDVEKTVKQASKWLYLDDIGKQVASMDGDGQETITDLTGKGYYEGIDDEEEQEAGGADDDEVAEGGDQIGKLKRKHSYWIRDYVTIDNLFDNALPSLSENLTDQSGIQLICIKSDRVKGENNEQGRIARFIHPRAGQRVWVHCSSLGRPPVDDLDFLDEEEEAPEGEPQPNEQEGDGEEDRWTTALWDIDTYWDRLPPQDPTGPRPVEFPLIVPQAELKEKYAKAPGEEKPEYWYYVIGKYLNADGQEKVERGWLKQEYLSQKFVHNWYDFGFTLDDAGEDYIHSFKHDEPASDFIQKIWEVADEPAEGEASGDHTLTAIELQNAMKDKKKGRILSHMICKHPTEWNFDRFAQFEEELIELFQVGIDAEEDAEKKQELEAIRDSTIDFASARMEKMSFWSEIQDGSFAEEESVHETQPLVAVPYSPLSPHYGDPYAVQEGEGSDCEDNSVMLCEDEEVDWPPPRTFPVSDDVVYHFHAIAFVEQMKRITASRYTPDHGDIHDPLINPQVRGWYGGGYLNQNSKIGGWNPYASMRIHSHKEQNLQDEVKNYGRPQRHTKEHSGLDIYAPVGTPIYACVDGTINVHSMGNKKAGFLTQLKGQYQGITYRFQYLHLMEFDNDRFRFYNDYGGKAVPNGGWLGLNTLTPIHNDPVKNEDYRMSYGGGILQIDDNSIDFQYMIDFNRRFKSKGRLKVKKGELIGYTGSTGNSYQGKEKNHLHFGIRDPKERVSPYELLGDYINLDASGEKTSELQDGVVSSENWK